MRNLINALLLFCLFFCLILIIQSCKEKIVSPPYVTTIDISEVTRTTAKSGGDITSDGNAEITSRGVCWNTQGNPSTTDYKTSDNNGTGAFTSSLTKLTPGTKYYVRAYATNEAGTSYGDQKSFTTGAILLATITTTNVTTITFKAAVSGGNITDDGGALITERGVCWSPSKDPMIINSKTIDGNGTGFFTSSITGLAQNSIYYVRAYATNSKGTSYGNSVSFKTADILTIITNTATEITPNSAVLGGNITSNGGSVITMSGICWSTSQNPTTADSHTTDGAILGNYSNNIIGLSANTLYYVRAYATTSTGITYGEQISFATKQNPIIPTLLINTVRSIVATYAFCDWSVISDGGEVITEYGIIWSQNPNPTIYSGTRRNYSGHYIGNITDRISYLNPSTTYYLRAYAINSVGIGYSPQVSFTTLTPGSDQQTVDLQGNIYKIVNIGTQIWMVDNLKTTIYNNGDPIFNVTDSSQWVNMALGAYCNYNNNESYVPVYGRLYNWYAAIDNRKICPIGWHVPSDLEWHKLILFLDPLARLISNNPESSIAGDMLKESGNDHWSTGGGSNKVGFTALPAGVRAVRFVQLHFEAIWWTTTEWDHIAPVITRRIDYEHDWILRNNAFKWYGISIRCLRD
jgi:uncharacterized protein (TIGR02145 family)